MSLSSLEMKTLMEYLPSQYCFTLTTLAVNGREVSQKTSAASLPVPGSLGNQILRLCVLPWRAVSLQPPLGAVNAQASLKDVCSCSHCGPLTAQPTAHSAHACRVWWEEPVCTAAQEVPKSRPRPSEQTYPDRHTAVAPIAGDRCYRLSTVTPTDAPRAPRSHGPVQEPVRVSEPWEFANRLNLT